MRVRLYLTAVACFAIAGLTDAVKLDQITLGNPDPEVQEHDDTVKKIEAENAAENDRIDTMRKQTATIDQLRAGVRALQEVRIATNENT